MTTRSTRDKWIKACDATVARETQRLRKAAALAQQCRDRIKAAEQRKEWLTAMPVDDPVEDAEDAAEPIPATDVAEPDVDEILDVKAAADAMPDDGDADDEWVYPTPEGVTAGPVQQQPVASTDDEPTTWANDDAPARA